MPGPTVLCQKAGRLEWPKFSYLQSSLFHYLSLISSVFSLSSLNAKFCLLQKSALDDDLEDLESDEDVDIKVRELSFVLL